MLPLQKEAAIEKKTNTCKVQHHPTYHWRWQIIQDNLESCIKMHHNKDGKEVTGKSQTGRGHWGRHLLQSQWTLNLKLTWVWQWCPISFKKSNGINTGLSKRDSTVRAQHHNSKFLWLICSSYIFFYNFFWLCFFNTHHTINAKRWCHLTKTVSSYALNCFTGMESARYKPHSSSHYYVIQQWTLSTKCQKTLLNWRQTSQGCLIPCDWLCVLNSRWLIVNSGTVWLKYSPFTLIQQKTTADKYWNNRTC